MVRWEVRCGVRARWYCHIWTCGAGRGVAMCLHACAGVIMLCMRCLYGACFVPVLGLYIVRYICVCAVCGAVACVARVSARHDRLYSFFSIALKNSGDSLRGCGGPPRYGLRWVCQLSSFFPPLYIRPSRPAHTHSIVRDGPRPFSTTATPTATAAATGATPQLGPPHRSRASKVRPLRPAALRRRGRA